MYENEQLKRQLEGINRERGELAHERDDVDAQLEDERRARQELNKALRAAEANNARLEEDLAAKATEMARMARSRDADKRELNKLRAAIQARSNIADTSTDELMRTAQELDHLRAELEQLKLEVRIQRASAQEAEEELTEVLARNEELGTALAEARAEVEQLNDVVTTLREELASAREVGEEGVQTAVAESQAHEEAVLRAHEEARVAKQELTAARARMRLLEDELSAVKAETKVATLESDLDATRQQLAALQEERDELAEEAAAAEADLRALAADAAAADQALTDAVRDAREQERAKLSEELSRVDELKAELERERQRYRELEEQLSDTQARLEEAKFRSTQYEAEYGMTDLVAELDAMRVENQRLQKDLAATSEDLRERMDTVYVLTEIARRLAKETGKYPADVNVLTIYDTGDLAAQHASLVEQLKADNAVLERQVEQLQQERVRLMREARVHARQAGEDGLFYFGLTGEQMRLVDEFAENLREGRVELPERDDSAALRRQLGAVRRELHEERARFTEASLAYADSMKGDSKPAGAEAATAEAAAATRKLLEDIRAENAKLQEALLEATKQQAEAAAAAALASRRDDDASSLVSGGSGDSFANVEPLIARVLKALQTAVATDKSIKKKDTSTVLRALKAALTSRDAARTENAESLRRLSAAEGSAAAEREKADVLRSEVGKLLAQLTSAQAAAAAAAAAAASTQPSPSPAATTTNLVFNAADGGPAATNELSAFVQVLRGYISREKAASALQSDAERYAAILGKLIAQIVALYKEHADTKRELQATASALRNDVQAAQALADGHKARADTAEQALQALEQGDEQARAVASKLKTAVRELTALQVQVPQLQRRAAIATADASAAAARAAAAEAAVTDAEAVAQSRILYLEVWKAGAAARLARADEVLRTWVPPAHAQAATSVLHELRQKYTSAAAAECELRLELAELRGNMREMSDLQHQNQLLASKVAEARAQTASAEQQCTQLRQALAAGSTGDQDKLIASLRADVARLTGEAGAQRVTAEAAAERARVLSERVHELQAEAAREAVACRAAAASLEAAHAAAASAETARDEALQRYAGSLDATAAAELRAKADQAESQAQGLRQEVQRLRGIADIAADQAASATALVQYRHEELRAARRAAQDVAAVTSDGAIVGKMQAEMLALKGSYAAFVRRYATLRASFQRLCASHAGLEAALDQRTARGQEALRAARTMELAAQQLVASIRLDDGQQGQLSSMQQHLQRLVQRDEQRAQELKRLRAQAEQADTEREQAVLACQAMQAGCLDVLAALGQPVRDQPADPSQAYSAIVKHLAAAAAAGMPDTATLPQQRLNEVATRLLASAEALRAARAEGAAVRRKFAAAQDELALASRRLVASDDAVASLEEENSLLRAQIARAAAASIAVAPAGEDDGSAPPAKRGQSITRDGQPARTAALAAADAMAQASATDSELKQLYSQLRQARAAAATAKRAGARRGARIQFLLGQLRIAGVELEDVHRELARGGHDGLWPLVSDAESDSEAHDSDGSDQAAPARTRAQMKPSALQLVEALPSEIPDSELDALVPPPPAHVRTRAQMHQYYAHHVAQLRAAAQQSVASLRAMLDAKNRMLQAYQTKLAGLRDELTAARTAAVTARHAAPGDGVAPSAALLELRAAVADMQRSSNGAPSEQAAAALMPALAARVDELEAALAQAESAARARGQGAAVDEAHATRVKALEGEVQRLQRLLDTSQTASELTQLKDTLSTKEKRLAALQASLLALKDEFVKLEAEKAALAEQAAKAAPQQSADADSELATKCTQLQRALKAARRASAEMEGKLRAVQAAGDADRAEALEHREAASRAWAEVRKLRQQVARLQEQAPAVPAPAHAPAPAPAAEQPPAVAAAANAAREAELKERLAVLQAQNSALKAAAAMQRESPPAAPAPAVTTAHVEQLERAKRQVNVLSGRLRERTDQLNAAQAELRTAQEHLDAASTDADHLRKRLAASQQRVHALDASASAALAELAPVADLTARVAELEAELAETQAALDGDVKTELAKLRAQVASEQAKADAAEASATEARAALASALAEAAGAESRQAGQAPTAVADGGPVLEPAQLREQLASAKRRIAELDGAVLTAAADLAQAQYQAAAATVEAERHARRLQELTAIASVVRASGAKHVPASTSAEQRGDDYAKTSRVQRSLHALRDTIATLKRTSERQGRDIERLRARLRAAEAEKAAAAEQQQQRAPRDSTQAAKVQALEEEVQSLQARLRAAKERATAAAGAGDGAGAKARDELARQQQQLEKLRTENDQLRQELSAFDAEFFEELEDLKYKYAAALAKCKAFDQYLAEAGQVSR